MKIVPLPAERAQQEKKERALRGAARGLNVLLLGLAVGALACLVGVLVAVIMLETGDTQDAARQTMLYILSGSFALGAVLFAAGSVLCGKLAASAAETHRDFAERLCGERCFFVGDGTIAEFCGEGIVIRSQQPSDKKPIEVPYRDIVFHSVCTRTRARERGKWSVVLELPAHYVMKRGEDPRALIETDGKERLYAALEALGLELHGEQPPRGKACPDTRFRLRTKFVLPDAPRRRRCALFTGLGAALLVAGVLIAVLWQDMMLAGAVLSVFGVFFGVRSAIGFAHAKGVFAVYEEGILWQESGRADADRFFLKWQQIERIARESAAGRCYLAAVCAYGSYHIPEAAGAYDHVRELHPELTEA